MADKSTERKPTLLLVEDDRHSGQSLRDYLEAKGYAVVWVTDGFAALREARRAEIELVVLDMFLPGQHGIDICRALKSAPACPKVVGLSAADLSEEIAAKLPEPLRPDRFFVKPVPMEQLAREIGILLGTGPVSERHPAAPQLLTTFAEVLVRRWRDGDTGMLEVEAEGILTHIFFLNGTPVFAERGRLDDTLGRMLVRGGEISEEQYEQALDRFTIHLEQGDQARLGDVLMELGLVSPERLYAALQGQVRQKILACFLPEHTHHRFQAGPALLERVTVFESPVEPLLFEGIRLHYRPERLAALLAADLPRFPSLRSRPSSLARRFGLSEAEQGLCTLLDGMQPLAAVLAAAPAGALAARQLVLCLRYADELRLADAPPAPQPTALVRPEPRPASPVQPQPRPMALVQPEPRPSEPAPAADPRRLRTPSLQERTIMLAYLRTKGRSDREILQLDRAEDPAAVDEAFARLSAPYAPEAIAVLPPGTMHARAVEIYAAMRRARDRLKLEIEAARAETAPESLPRSQRSTQRPRVEAEQAFHRGVRLLDRGEPERAWSELLRATELLPLEKEYLLYRAWVELMLAQEPEAARQAADRAAEVAAELLRQQPTHGMAHYVTAQTELRAGRFEEARQHFTLAAEHDPANVDARRQLVILARREKKDEG
ncbi:MAG: response regulator [Deltaproteobacteria bacterium]|nr:response regulator [Deltaproteobacteria bacterium]